MDPRPPGKMYSVCKPRRTSRIIGWNTSAMMSRSMWYSCDSLAASSAFFSSSLFSLMVSVFSRSDIALSCSENAGVNPNESLSSPRAIIARRRWMSARDMMSVPFCLSSSACFSAIYANTSAFFNSLHPSASGFLYPAFLAASVAFPPFFTKFFANASRLGVSFTMCSPSHFSYRLLFSVSHLR